MTALTHLQAHLHFAPADTQTKNCKRACKFPSQEKLFFKIPSLQIFLKRNRTTHARTASQQFYSETDKLKWSTQLDTVNRTAGHNTGFASGGVMCKLGALCFVSSVVLADSFVLRNPPERKARNRQAVKKVIFF